MKKLILLTAAVALCIQMKAQDSKFVENMKITIAMIDSAKTVTEFINIANRFERIAAVEEKNWLPYYYASLNYSIASFIEEDKKIKDQYVDKAEEMVLKATELTEKNNSELLVMQAYVTNARLAVKPSMRGRKLGPLFNAQIEIAKKANPDNPRIYCLAGESTYYTPAMWGGGKDKALPILETAIEKFKIYKPESEIHPNWGQKRCEEIIIKCKEI